MLPIAYIQGDDERFLALVTRIAAATIQDFRPADVFVTRIDHWFDHKWLGFSGKLLGALGVHKRKRLTIPPFMPRRVVSHHAYTLDAGTATYHVASLPPLHRHQQSSDNLTRYIDRVSPSGVFIWFSGGTSNADHGSVMVYTSHAGSQSAWYASFRRVEDWRLHKVRGLSMPELTSIIERGADAHAD
jgi:hypothetical protein